jgi:vacuolar-type H+-ATPase subunit C/Vma6
MDEFTLQELKNISEIKELIEFIRMYYPGLNFNTYTIEDIEVALNETYIKLIGRILSYVPIKMKRFLRNYLLKYEIRNIKNIILGTIVGMNTNEKLSLVNQTAEIYLNNTDFIKGLTEITSLDEIQLYVRNTKYNKAIREGLLYFKNENEVFVLEAFLDQLYYENLKREMKYLGKKEKKMISLYVRYITEIYNLNTIYRGIINKINPKLLKQFLVENYLFLERDKLENLINLTNTDDFILLLTQYYKKITEIRLYFISSTLNEKHLIWSIEKIYIDYYFKTFKIKIDDIDYQTIFRILEVLIKKDDEIRLYVLPKVVKLLQKKFKILKK